MEASWDEIGYSDIVAAVRQDRDVAVEFANGDVVRIPASALGIVESEFEVEPGLDDGLSLHLIASDGRTIEVSWEPVSALPVIRSSQELRRRDAEQSRRIGLRLKALREDRRLNQRETSRSGGDVCTAAVKDRKRQIGFPSFHRSVDSSHDGLSVFGPRWAGQSRGVPQNSL